MLGNLYNLLIILFEKLFPILRFINPKLKLFVEGRKDTLSFLSEKIDPEKYIYWFHCASLGEYEQGVPVMEALKASNSDCQLLITFFSPSGYEIKKKSSLPDIVCYLPIDTPKNSKQFLDIVKPTLAVFIKYEFWPNYLKVLERNHIKTIFISVVFRKSQVFFKWYGQFMKQRLNGIDHFFLQDTPSESLIQELGLSNYTLSGDTRFDRVTKQLSMDNQVDFIEDFVKNRLCVVFGSSWPEDEAIFINFINNAPKNVCFIIAPHEIKSEKINSLTNKLKNTFALYSAKENKDLSSCQTFVVDTIGYLSRVYSYSHIAYVGGGMGTSGLHNILEPATFGVPIIIGCNFEKFREAKELQKLGGLFSIKNTTEFESIINKLISDSEFRDETGKISEMFIKDNTGATDKILDYLKE